MRTIVAALLALSWLSPVVGLAAEYSPEDEDRLMRGGLTQEHGLVLLQPGETVADRVAFDLNYAASMRAHHYGAVDMAEQYLSDPEANNPVLRRLARAIIPNQRFEMAVLENVIWHVQQEPREIMRFGDRQLVWRSYGLSEPRHHWKVVETPAPNGLTNAFTGTTPVTARDVRFAREMLIHHGAAIERAGAFNADPRADNLPLRRLNRQIILEQAYEVALMASVVEDYEGDPRAVRLEMIMPTERSEEELIALSRDILRLQATGYPQDAAQRERIQAMGMEINEEARAEATPLYRPGDTIPPEPSMAPMMPGHGMMNGHAGMSRHGGGGGMMDHEAGAHE